MAARISSALGNGVSRLDTSEKNPRWNRYVSDIHTPLDDSVRGVLILFNGQNPATTNNGHQICSVADGELLTLAGSRQMERQRRYNFVARGNKQILVRNNHVSRKSI